MADEITYLDEMIYDDRETPWHRKGIPWNTREDGILTPAIALDRAAPWRVERRPLFTVGGGWDAESRTGPLVEIPDRYAIVRDDNDLALGILSGEYEPYQHADGFAVVDALLAEAGGSVEVETAGTLREGRIVWLLCRLDRDIVIGGDRHLPYFLFFTSHDGSYAVTFKPTTIRVVCKNTLDMAIYRDSLAFRQRHSADAEINVEAVRRALDFGYRYYDAFEAEVRSLQETGVSEARFDEIVEGLFPDLDESESTPRGEAALARRRDAVHDLWESDPRVGSFRGTGWGVVQAFSTYELWIKRVRGDRAERQMLAAIGGGGSRLSEKARALVHAGSTAS